MGTPGCVNKRAGGKRVCGRFRSEYAYSQKARPWLCWVGDREDIEESDDGDDGQRRGANKRRSNDIRQTIGLIRDNYASWRNSRITKKGERIDCNISNHVPFVVPRLSTSSSTTPTPSSSSSSQDSVLDESRYTENPVPARSGSTNEKLRGNPLHESTETKNKNKNEGHEDVQSDQLHDLPDWLQEFREK